MCAEIWREDIKWQPSLEVDADSYNAWVTKLMPQIKTMVPGEATDPKATKVRLGEFVFHVRMLPTTQPNYVGIPGLHAPLGRRRCCLETYYGGKHGEVSFTGEVLIPIITDPKEQAVWMSLTPMEIITQRAGIKKARGRVLIGGLGMGWFARRVLERKKVKHVVVADTNKDILDYFGKPLKEEFGDKVELLHRDVFKCRPLDYDSCLLDIWPYYSNAQEDDRLKELMEIHPNVWAWGKGVNQ